MRGKGRYTDDFNLPGQAYGVVVRSTHAHGLIRGIGTDAARAMPGVLGVWTGKDLDAAGYGPFTCGLPLKSRDGSPLLQTNRQPLATDKVRFVGDPIAFVVAETLAQARDAAEAVERRHRAAAGGDAIPRKRPSPARRSSTTTSRTTSRSIITTATSRRSTRRSPAPPMSRKVDIENTRVAVVSMEPRVGLASYDKTTERYTIQMPTQGVAGNRANLAEEPEGAEREGAHPHRQCRRLLRHEDRQLSRIHAASCTRRRRSGKPGEVDSTSAPTSFLSDSHGRAQEIHAELALDAEGHFLAVRSSPATAISAPTSPALRRARCRSTPAKNFSSVYRTPLMGVDIKTVLTNTTLMGAYRGAGRPEANYYMERLIDRAADEMGINRLTLRKRNFIKASQMPFPASSGVTYDSGDFQAVFNKALDISDHDELRQAQEGEQEGAASCAASRSAPISR